MIGITGYGLDSVIVAKSLREKLPEIDMLCLCDNLHSSYAEAGHPDMIIKDAIRNTGFLVNRGARLILIASHSLSGIGAKAIASAFDIPVIESIQPTVDKAISLSRYNRFGIIGNRQVVEKNFYQDRIRGICPEAKIYSASCPLLAHLVEEGWVRKPVTAMIVKKYLMPLKIRQVDTLILGSARFSPIFDVIQKKIGRRVKVIDSSGVIAEAAAELLDENPDLRMKMTKSQEIRVILPSPSGQTEKMIITILNCPVEIIRYY